MKETIIILSVFFASLTYANQECVDAKTYLLDISIPQATELCDYIDEKKLVYADYYTIREGLLSTNHDNSIEASLLITAGKIDKVFYISTLRYLLGDGHHKAVAIATSAQKGEFEKECYFPLRYSGDGNGKFYNHEEAVLACKLN